MFTARMAGVRGVQVTVHVVSFDCPSFQSCSPFARAICYAASEALGFCQALG